MSERALCRLLIVALLAAYAAFPARAGADGDPASDVLATQASFVPLDANLTNAQRARLTALLHGSERAGFPLRVAIVNSPLDLGAITELWRKPAAYARFLGIELSLVYAGPVLVVMPNGFGWYWAGHAGAAAERVLARIAIAPSGEGWIDAVRTALRELAPIVGSSARPARATEHGGGDTLEVLVAVLLAGVLAALAVVISNWRAARERARAAATRSALARRVILAWLGWAVPVAAIAVAAVVIVHALNPPSHSRAGTTSASLENPPTIFPGSSRQAPGFQLTDADGRPVSLAAYRGHWVIVTFADPLAGAADAASARILARAEHELPPAQRPPILAVSVDVAGDQRVTLERASSAWGVPPQWHWLIGSQAQLAAVWRSYFAVVELTRERVAGATLHRISHSKMVYLIDNRGYERLLFGWPFRAKELAVNVQRFEGL